MNAVYSLLTSTIGKKVAMAVTGAIMVGYLLIHMGGNMLLYAGPEALNAYGEKLQHSGPIIWIVRAVMLLSIVVHIWSAKSLTQRNYAARPTRYAAGQSLQVTSYAARFMLYGGVVLLLFILFHLAHLTLGVFSSDMVQAEEFVRGDVYRNVVVGFSNPVVAGFYILANIALGFHLWHGIESGLQTLGVNHPKYNPMKRRLSVGTAVLIAGGNISFPISVLSGIVQ